MASEPMAAVVPADKSVQPDRPAQIAQVAAAAVLPEHQVLEVPRVQVPETLPVMQAYST